MKPKISEKYAWAFQNCLSEFLCFYASCIILFFAPFIVTDQFQYKSKLVYKLYSLALNYLEKTVKKTFGINNEPLGHV